jgi:hypothetical protein
MTPGQMKRALKLYDAFKCDTMAYDALARECGMRTTELNARCHEYRRRNPKKTKAK